MGFGRTDTPSRRRLGRSLSVLSGGLAVLCALALASCHISAPPEECAYNLQMRYRYFREMSDTRNVVDNYVKSIEEYVFDSDGVLFTVNRLPGNSCDGPMVSESTVPDGRYTVVAIGNLASASSLSEAVPGVTTLDEMSLLLNNAVAYSGEGGAMHGDSERLYYGYSTFTVGGLEATRLNVDMFHSHCVLSVTVKWRSGAPESLSDVRISYREVPGGYMFRPGYAMDGDRWKEYVTGGDSYLSTPVEKRCYIPGQFADRAMVTHTKEAVMNVDKKILTQFVTYRYTDDSPLLMSIHSAEGQVMKEIDLQRFFRAAGINLDTNYRQEFDLQFEIDGDNVSVGFVSVSDWDEGGVIGGR